MRHARFAFRSLRKDAALTLLVILSLGLGIGGNTAIFSLIQQSLLASLPVQNPDRLVTLEAPGRFKAGSTSTNDSGGEEAIFSLKMLRILEANPHGFDGIAGFQITGGNLGYNGGAERATLAQVSGRYFQVLGVNPVLGRTLEPSDDHGTGNTVAVLSYGFWKEKLGGNPAVLNTPMRVNGVMFTVVGVLPETFGGTTLGSNPVIYVPISLRTVLQPGWKDKDSWTSYWVYVFGRLKDGYDRNRASEALNTVYRSAILEQAATIEGRTEQYVREFKEQRLTLNEGKFGHSSVRKEMRTPLFLLLAITGLVLIIAAANAANLLLARAVRRHRELAVRVAIGASRSDIFRQILMEALVLAFAGAVSGVLIGYWALRALLSDFFTGGNPPEFLKAELDPTVLLFTTAIAMATGFLFGLYPAIMAARDSAAGTLREEAGNVTSSGRRASVRRALVSAQIAMSLALLIPMGLFLQSLSNVARTDLGMRIDRLVTFSLAPSLNRYAPEKSALLWDQINRELRAIPGVTGVASAFVPLISGNNWGNSIIVEGRPFTPDNSDHSFFNAVSEGFFSQMGIPLVAGREFTERDTPASPKVIVVNETFVKAYFPDGKAIGKRMAVGYGPDVQLDAEIVGVVRNSKYSGVKQEIPKLYYEPIRQKNDAGLVSFYVRSALPPDRLSSEIRSLMGRLDRDLPVENLRTMNEQVARSFQSDRMLVRLVGAFAVLAIVLSMLGLYGVMSYNVARRTREIGIRMALGAAAATIRGLVLREVLWVVGIGLVIGLPIAVLLSRFAESQLHGVKSSDPFVIAGAAGLVTLAALAAGYFPARRASGLNPTQALRED